MTIMLCVKEFCIGLGFFKLGLKQLGQDTESNGIKGMFFYVNNSLQTLVWKQHLSS